MKSDNLQLTSEVRQKDRQLQHHQDELEVMKEMCVNSMLQLATSTSPWLKQEKTYS